MFGVGWTEMLVIGVVALIVIGPKDLPVVMNRLGKAISSIRKMGTEFQRELNKATGLEQVTDLRKSITEPLKQTAAEITREFNKPLPGGGVAPSGAIKPKDPKVESVVDEIHASVGMTPPSAPTPAGTPASSTNAPATIAAPAPSSVTPPAPLPPAAPATPPAPAPVEVAAAETPARKPRAKAAKAADGETGAEPPKPRKRTPKAKPEASDG